MPLSHFDESSGIVPCDTPWGRWWQTVSEVFIDVNVAEGTKARDVIVTIKPGFLECKVKENIIFSGPPFRKIVAEECTWTIEEKKRVHILLAKADPANAEKVWESLLVDQYAPNPWIMNEMRKKLDLERFQIENPGFNFSGATLSKCYDNVPLPRQDETASTKKSNTTELGSQCSTVEVSESSNRSSGDLSDVIQSDANQKREWL